MKCMKWLYPYVQVIGVCDEFLAQGLHLKSHQRCSAGIRTWLSADQSDSYRAIKKISPLIYSQSWVGSWVYTNASYDDFHPDILARMYT